MLTRLHLVVCALLSAVGAAACAHGDDSTAPDVAALAGDWTQGASLADSANHQTHIHTGSFAFRQRGETFSGSGRQFGFCHAPSGDYEGPLADGAPFDVRDGVVQGSRVTFTTTLCRYEGEISADGRHMSGTTRCAYTLNGTDFVFAGDWLADRRP